MRQLWRGLTTMAAVVDWLSHQQLVYKLGALPILYTLLELLEVRRIVNAHCPTAAEVDHGTVVLVLILNRLLLPLPLYQVSAWVAQTVLPQLLNVPAAKFNDDRLGRTLDALEPQLATLWRAILETALRKVPIDLSCLFYDLTGVVAHGRYAASELLDFGFAHNTPANKRKLKLALNVSADGGLPWSYRLWSGRTTDQATVQQNLEHLAQWLRELGRAPQQTLVVGDRAMLNAEIALAYDQAGLHHLSGLRANNHDHKALLPVWSDAQFANFPLVAGADPQYWGRGAQVTFTYAGQQTTHKALVVLAGPLRDQLRAARMQALDELEAELATLRSLLGQPRMRTEKAIWRRVKARLKAAPVGDLLHVTVYEAQPGQWLLHWQRDTAAIAARARYDGRYLLVTNDWSLSHRTMFARYREKDKVETCFHICKSDLKLRPLYVHQEQRIAALLWINMSALLVYTLLQRQIQQQGLQLTTRQLLQRLARLQLIETHCWDGSCLQRLTPIDPALAALLQLVAQALAELVATVSSRPHPCN